MQPGGKNEWVSVLEQTPWAVQGCASIGNYLTFV
jgi:hypothetical protein